MLELSQIGFAVNTKPLEEAATKLAALGTAAGKLAGDLKKLDKASADAAINQNKVNLAAEKTATQAAKTAEVLERTETKKLKAIEKTTKATKDAQAAQVGLVDSMERKRDLISEGWTRGESSILKTAEAIGIVGDEYKRLQSLLKDIGGLVSSPFDSSLGSLRSIQKEFDGLVLRSKLVDQGIELTTTQLKQFARIAAEASVAVKKMGMDPTEGAGLAAYNKLLTDAQDEYLKVAVASKSMLDGEKLLAKQHRDTASAKSFLIKEDERMVSVTEQLNTGTNRSVSISEKAAIATANYARALKTAGVAGDEAKTRLAKYSAAQQLASQKEEQRAAANLARALQPQATDVLVSLWSGQNPLTVMLQQGGQVVDLFKLSGVEAGKLGTTMKAAFAGMLPSIMAVGSAVGGLLVDGLMAAGMGFGNMIAKGLLLDKVMNKMGDGVVRLSMMFGDFDTAANNLQKFEKFTQGFGKTFAVAAIAGAAALVLLLAEMYNIMKAQSEMNVAVATTGASLGLSSAEAFKYATSLDAVEVSSMKGIAIMTEVAKAGNLEAEMFSTIAKSASEMQKYAGQSIEDTVKQFSKLADEPSKALTEIAIKTGYITAEVLEQVTALEQQGKMVEAVQLAQEAYGESNIAIAKEIKANLSTLEKAWFDIKSAIGAVQQVMFEFATNTTVVEAFGKAWAVSAIFISESWWLIKEIGKTLGATASAYISFMSGDFKGALNIGKERLSDLKASREEQNKYVQSLLKGNSVNQESAKLAADEREKNSKQAQIDQYTNKLIETGLTSQQKAINEVTKLQGRLNEAKSQGLDTTLLEAQTEIAIQKQRDIIYGKDKKPKADKEQKELDNYIKKTEERIRDLGIQATGVTEDITASGKALMDIMDDKLWLSLTQEMRDQWGLLLRKSEEQEKLNKQIEQEKKLTEDISKIRNDNNEFIRKSVEDNRKITDGYDLQLELLGKTEEQQKLIRQEAELRNKVAEAEFKFAQQRLKVEQDFAKLKNAKGADIAKINAEITAAQAEIDKQRSETLGVINKGVAVQASVDYYNEMQKVASELAGVISTALFEGGQAGSKKLRDYLVNLLRQKITLEIEANITSLLTSNGGGNSGGMLGALDSLAGLVSGGAGGSMSNGLMSLIGGSKNIGNTLVKGAGAASDWLNTAGFTNLGKGFESISNAIAPFSQTINKVSDSLGYLNSAILATEGKWGAAIGSAIGTYFGGGIGSFIGEKLGGFVDNLFGGGRSYSKGGGIEGSFSNKGFSGNSYSTTREEVNQWNSWMGQSGSDKKSTQVLNTATTDSLSNQFLSIQNSIANFSKALGVDASAIMSYSKAINIETLSTAQAEEMLKARTILANTDSSTEEKEKAQKVLDDLSKITSEKFTKLFTDITNEMASLVISSDFIRSGESSADALARIATSLSVVNSVLTQFDASLLEVSQSGGNSASNLIDAFGGLEKFSQVTSDYYQNFFTETERTASSVAVLTQAFADLGIKMPEVDGSTRAWYRSQVDAVLALDKTVPANAALIASVLGLQGAVNELAPSFDSVREKAEQLKNTNRDLQDQLDILTGKETKRTLELRDATDESTRVIIRQIHAQQDLNDAAEKASKAISEVSFNMEEYIKWSNLGLWNKDQYDAYVKVEDLRKKAADNYFKAQEQVTQAQQQLADALNNTVKSFEDFLGTLNNASSPTEQLSSARTKFSDLTVRAQAGDTEAIGQLTTSAKTFLDLSKGYSKSIVDYRRDEAKVRIVLEQGIKAGKEQLAKLPVEMQKSTDPLKAAYDQLAKAIKDEESAKTIAIAVQADLTKSEDDLAKEYLKLIKVLPNSENLKKFFDDTFKAVEEAAKIAKAAAEAAKTILANLTGSSTGSSSSGGSFTGPTQGENTSSGTNIVVPPTGGSSMVVEPTAGNLVTENTGPTDLGAGYASIKQGQDEYNKMLAASGVNNSTGNSIDVFNSGTARMYTNQGVQYASVFEFAKILQDYAETNGKEATKEFAFNYGATDSVLAEFRKYTAGAPKFAAGGYHSGGYRVVGEGGPELEATGASRIFNANQTANILGGGMSDQLLTVIAEKLDTMSKNNTLENNVLITHAKKTSSLLDKFDQLGIATRA